MKASRGDQGARSSIPVCLTMADTTPPVVFFLLLVVFFYLVPLLILLVLYVFIIRHLMPDTSNTSDTYHARAKRHVITMLLSVVFSFFVCLSPYRILVFYIIVAPAEQIAAIDRDTFFVLLNLSRILFYLHSALDPVLYNLMSSKFRKGFAGLCRATGCRLVGSRRSNAAAPRRTDTTEQEENFL